MLHHSPGGGTASSMGNVLKLEGSHHGCAHAHHRPVDAVTGVVRQLHPPLVVNEANRGASGHLRSICQFSPLDTVEAGSGFNQHWLGTGGRGRQPILSASRVRFDTRGDAVASTAEVSRAVLFFFASV